MKTQTQALNYIKSKIGTGVDFDGQYGYQCADLSVDYMYYVTDGEIRMWGNAKDLINNDFKGLATVHKNTSNFLPKKGDVAVITTGNFGHTQVVLSGDLNQYTVVEQNWLGGGAALTEFATKRTHSYVNGLYFIRPKFKKSSTEKRSVKKPKVKGWSVNKYGTYYKKEKATFICGSQPITTFIGSPKITAPKGYEFQPKGWTNYDEVCIADGYVFIGYDWKGKRYYLPIRTCKGVPPNHKLGKLWGVIK